MCDVADRVPVRVGASREPQSNGGTRKCELGDGNVGQPASLEPTER
jgi:hypothetical protein